MTDHDIQSIGLHAVSSAQPDAALCKSCTLDSLCHPKSIQPKTLDTLDKVLSRGVRYNKGDYLFHQGEPFDAVYAVRSGSLKTYVVTSNGQEQITNFYFATEMAGISGLNMSIYPVSAVAMETTTVCKIPFSKLEELSLEIPELRESIYSTIGKELHNFEEMMLTLSKKNADERLATFLMNLSCRYKKRGYSASSFRLTMSRNEIGNFLGLAVETVSRVFSRFQKQLLINVEGKEIQLLKPNKLIEISGNTSSLADLKKRI